MGLLIRSLAMLVLVLCFVRVHCTTVKASSSSRSQGAKTLDVILQDYAYRALVNPITGTIYNATQIPSSLAGVKVAALRLRSGSLRRRGVAMYNEFEIPKGIIERPYVERLVLVYQNLGNVSTLYYPLPNHSYLAPVLGLLAYNGSDLSATNLSVLDVHASRDPIQIKFHDVKSAPGGTLAKCVWFDLEGSSDFSSVTGGNTCSTYRQGHYSIVVESTPPPAPAPAPVSPVPAAPAPQGGLVPSTPGESKSSNKKTWVTVGSVLGGLALFVALSLLVLLVCKFKRKKRLQHMERAAEVGEPLHMASVGDTRAPAATYTRTQPTLEHEYTP